MRAVLFALALAAVLAAPAAFAQDEEGEGTYSTYSSDDARVELPAGYVEVDVQGDGQAQYVSAEQQLFDVFWYELSKHGRWVEDPTYSWVWYPDVPGFRPYSDGWWVYTTEGWTYESTAPYAWAVYHYGRWAFLSGAWAWLPGYEWSPGWVTMRVSGDYIGWAPIGPGGYVWEYWPSGWGYSYSPWLFVTIGEFGRRHHHHHYCDHRRGESAYHEAQPLPGGHGHGKGGSPSFKEIPNTHHAEPIPVVEGSKPSDPGAPNAGTVVIYRPRPTLSAPTYGASSGGASSGGGAGGYHPKRPERPVPNAPGRSPGAVGQPWSGSRAGPAVAPQRPSAPPAPAGTRFRPPETGSSGFHQPTPPPMARPPTSSPGFRPAPRPEARPVAPPSYSRPTPPPAQPSVRPPPPPQARPQVAPAPVPQPVQQQPARPSHPVQQRKGRD